MEKAETFQLLRAFKFKACGRRKKNVTGVWSLRVSLRLGLRGEGCLPENDKIPIRFRGILRPKRPCMLSSV